MELETCRRSQRRARHGGEQQGPLYAVGSVTSAVLAAHVRPHPSVFCVPGQLLLISLQGTDQGHCVYLRQLCFLFTLEMPKDRSLTWEKLWWLEKNHRSSPLPTASTSEKCPSLSIKGKRSFASKNRSMEREASYTEEYMATIASRKNSAK